MKPELWGVFLLLLIACSALIASSHETTMANKKNANLYLDNFKRVANNDGITERVAEKAKVTEHKISTAEIEQLKSRIGVYDAEQDYNQIVDGHGTGLQPPTEDEWAKIAASSYSVESVDDQAGAPAAVDESTKPWFPPIGNQGQQGSCVAWAVGYYTKTFQEAKEHGWSLSGGPQSEIMSPAFIYNLINGGVDKGSGFQNAIQLVCSIGACSLEKMPYNPSNYTRWPSEEAWTEAALYRGNSSGAQYMDLSSPSGLANLKNWIASDNLAIIGVDSTKYAGLDGADVLTLDSYVSPDVDHANTIVGYDDSKSYTENGTTYYGAFKVANSWGKGGWEKIPDGFYWISYETMKQRVGDCMFYYDRIGYQPQLLATFRINHQIRSECDIRVGLGSTTSPTAIKSFSQYINGGALPFPQNNIVSDITEFMSFVPTVLGKTFFLRVYDSGTSTIGNVTTFAVDNEESKDAPRATVQLTAVYLNVTLSIGKILINSSVSSSLPNQRTAAGNNVSLFFGNVKWSITHFYLLMSKDNLSQVSTNDIVYTPTFNAGDLNASAIAAYTSASGSWQVGYNWVNGTIATNIAGGKYFFKAFADLSTPVPISDTSMTVVGVLQVTPTSGPRGTAISVEGYSFTTSSSVNITYLNPVSSKWMLIVNNTPTDAFGHFNYTMTAPDLMHDQPAGDSSALFDQIVFRGQDNSDSTYYNGTTPFCEFRRGLSQFGNAIAAGLYGNNTDLTPSVQVVVGRSLPVVGEWFTPGNVIFQLDGTVFDTAVTDSLGHFSKTITVPATTVGAHTIRMLNAGSDFLVTVTVIQSLVSSDDYDNLWHSADFTIALTCVDNGKGIAATYYKLNNGPIKSVSVDGQPRITTEGASNILEYWSVDGVGNEEYSHKMLTEIKLDKTTPTGSIQINSGANYARSSNVTLTLTAADTESGVFQIRFSNDGLWDTEQWEAPASTKNWILTSGDGSKTVYYQIKDNAGIITSYNSSVILDETKPVANAGQNRVVNLGSNVTLDASECTDNLGIISYGWNFGDGTTGTGKTATHTYSSSGAYTVTLIAQDAAGNTGTSTTTITVEANVIPEIPSFIVLLSFLFASLLVSVAYKRRPMKTKLK